MKKIKLRFSYFLICGLIGIILQVAGYFSWGTSEIDLVSSQITVSSSMDYFNKYRTPSLILIFASLFIILFAVGIIIGAKKDQIVAKINAYALGATQIVTIITLIIFLVFTSLNRKTMFSNNTNAEVLRVLVSIKNAALFVSALAFSGLGFALVSINKNRKIGRVASWAMFGVNALFVLSMVAVFFGAIGTPSYALLSRLFNNDTTLALPFTCKEASMNGYTYGNTFLILNIIQDTLSTIKTDNFTSVTVGGTLAFISCLSYIVTLIVNFLGLSGLIIESFDVVRDDDRLAL